MLILIILFLLILTHFFINGGTDNDIFTQNIKNEMPYAIRLFGKGKNLIGKKRSVTGLNYTTYSAAASIIKNLREKKEYKLNNQLYYTPKDIIYIYLNEQNINSKDRVKIKVLLKNMSKSRKCVVVNNKGEKLIDTSICGYLSVKEQPYKNYMKCENAGILLFFEKIRHFINYKNVKEIAFIILEISKTGKFEIEKFVSLISDENADLRNKIKNIRIPEYAYVGVEKNGNFDMRITLPYNYENQSMDELVKCQLNYKILNYFNTGPQWGIPNYLADAFQNIKFELFASPFNCHHDYFGSLFIEDEPFGSLGNAFTILNTLIENKPLMYKNKIIIGENEKIQISINPPFKQDLCDMLWDMLIKLLTVRKCYFLIAIGYKHGANYLLRDDTKKYLQDVFAINDFVDYTMGEYKDFATGIKFSKDFDFSQTFQYRIGLGIILSTDQIDSHIGSFNSIFFNDQI